MSRTSDLLDQINIPTPCDADWDHMIGNERVRFCEHCSKSVTNLSTMTRKQALELVSRSKGQMCVRYYKRPDGTVHTETAQGQLYQLKRRASRIAAGAFSAALGLSSSALAAQAASPAPQLIATAFQLTEGGDVARSANSYAGSASLVGTITDPNGAVIQGVNVVLIEVKTNTEQTATTDSEGVYRFQSLEAGEYTLRMDASGFTQQRVEGIVLQDNDEKHVDAMLQLGETVSVGGAMVSVPDEPLVKASFENDPQAVKDLLASGVDVNRRDKSIGATALDEAVENGNREIVQALLDAGADVNARNSRRQTPLMRLDEDGTARLVEDLVRAGAKVNLKDEDGDTALMLAASYSNAEVVQALVRAGARLDAANHEGRTAIMKAAEYGNLEIVEMLFDLGADINRQDKEGETALTLAQDNERDEVLEFLKAHNAIEFYRPEKEEKK